VKAPIKRLLPLAKLARSENRPKANTFTVLAFSVSLSKSGRSFDMENTNKNVQQSSYQIGNTLYQVTPVFNKASDAEHISDKIKRLILKDEKGKAQ